MNFMAPKTRMMGLHVPDGEDCMILVDSFSRIAAIPVCDRQTDRCSDRRPMTTGHCIALAKLLCSKYLHCIPIKVNYQYFLWLTSKDVFRENVNLVLVDFFWASASHMGTA